jgi:transcriptional regulator with XRE-family HTH domain
MMKLQEIGLELQGIRRLRGLSQKQVAKLSGVGEKTISSFETGERIDGMSVRQLFALLECYGMSPMEFFGNQLMGQMREMQQRFCELMCDGTHTPKCVSLRRLLATDAPTVPS